MAHPRGDVPCRGLHVRTRCLPVRPGANAGSHAGAGDGDSDRRSFNGLTNCAQCARDGDASAPVNGTAIHS